MVIPLARRVRGLLGLVTLGEGLFISSRVVPHEPLWLGILLSLLGAGLLWRADLPRLQAPLRPVPRAAIAALALLAAIGVLAYDAIRRSPIDPPKIAIIVVALATAALALSRRHDSALVWSVPLAWAPLAVWAAQGAAESLMGVGGSPLDAFVRYGLLPPMALALSVLGHSPTIDGQTITYATPNGPFALHVGVACSGVQAMALFGGVVAAYLVTVRPSWRRGLLWSAIGIAGVYVVNVIRLVTLALVGSAWGADALETTHAQAGWIFFVVWTAIFAWLAIARAPRAAGAAQPVQT